MIVGVLVLAALPLTLAAVAVRPSRVTVRTAGMTLLAVPLVVVLIFVIGAIS